MHGGNPTSTTTTAEKRNIMTTPEMSEKNRKRYRKKWSVLVLAALFFAFAGAGRCLAVEFVTQAAFTVEKNPYKGYPFRVLFQRFHGADASEKRKIRNVIILKQVFEPEARRFAEGAGFSLEPFFGVVKEINEENLRLWLPETDSFIDIHVGIDRIPLKNDRDDRVTAANIGKFAVVAHTRDQRIYMLDIRFELAPPKALHLQRRNGKNIVKWREPDTAVAPSGYRVFVNGKSFKKVDRTTVEVPRSQGLADEYYVKALYAHKGRFIASAASETLYDETAAREIQKRRLAEKNYAQVIAALNPSGWPDAKRRLSENRTLFDEYLNPERKGHIRILTGIFRDLDAGDRLADLQPQTAENLDGALAAFRRAEQRAAGLPPQMDATAIARVKITETANRRQMLATGRQKELAVQTYDRIAGALNPSQWPQAAALLSDNRELLLSQLDADRKGHITALTGIFRDLDAGDRLADLQPQTAENLDGALAAFRRAEQRAAGLPPQMDATAIARVKITETANRRQMLATGRQKELAVQTYDRIAGALNPSQWPQAAALLSDNRELLLSQLDAGRKGHITALTGIFRDLDEGGRLADLQPQTAENLDGALAAFRRAEQRAAGLPPQMDATAIARVKITETANRRQMLASGRQKELAVQTYDRIAGALNPSQWPQAAALLSDNRELLLSQLDAGRKGHITALTGIFRDLDAGDRLAESVPETMANRVLAMKFYRSAQEKSGKLPDDLSPGLIARSKIDENAGKIAQLEKRMRVETAETTYAKILAALNRSEWEAARALVYDNRNVLADHLNGRPKEIFQELIAFFKDMEEGDHYAGQKPETMRNLSLADRYYRRAEQKAKTIPEALDLALLTQIKISENDARKTGLAKAQQEQTAEKAYERIQTALNEKDREAARNLMNAHQMLLLDQLALKKKEALLGLIEFFGDVDEGDRLAALADETTQSLEMAMTFYRRAEKRSGAFAGELDAGFIAAEKMEKTRALLSQRGAHQQRHLAERTYAQAIAAVNPARWQTARTMLSENRELLETYLDGREKGIVAQMMAFFDEIDAGDRFAYEKPATNETLEKALSVYSGTREKAAALADVVDLGFITDMKINNILDRKARISKSQNQQIAGQTYERILGALTPSDWQTARTLLAENETMLTEYPDAERKNLMKQLVTFFQHIDEGDRMTGLQPQTREKLEMAQASYRLAEQKAQSLADVVDLSFIVSLKRTENDRLQAAVETQRKMALAARIYEQIVQAVNPSQWETARKLALEKMKLLTDYLDPNDQDTAVLLVDFFRDIDEGDQRSLKLPESEETLDSALAMFRQAEEKGIALSNRLDVLFISELKINALNARRAAFTERQEAILAGRQVRQPVETASEAPETPDPFDDSVDPETAVKRGMMYFDARKYPLSLRYFGKVYPGQIKNLRLTAKKQIFGLLGLPPAFRGEITFLVKLDQLRKERGGDPAAIREGLLEMVSDIDGSIGPWSVITAKKKNKIRRHIERY